MQTWDGRQIAGTPLNAHCVIRRDGVDAPLAKANLAHAITSKFSSGINEYVVMTYKMTYKESLYNVITAVN
jgi:hypothetical protein